MIGCCWAASLLGLVVSAVAAVAEPARAGIDGLSVQLGTHANVSLLVDGAEWLRSDDVSLQVSSRIYRASDASLTLVNSSSSHGVDDRHGSFIETTWFWSVGPGTCGGRVAMQTTVRVYTTTSLVFRQAFPCALELQPDASQSLASSWPSFVSAVDPASNTTVGFDRSLTYNGRFLDSPYVGDGLAGCSVQTQGGVPIALFKTANGSRVGRSLLFSQHTRMKTAELACGPAAAAPLLPPPPPSPPAPQPPGGWPCRIVAKQHFSSLVKDPTRKIEAYVRNINSGHGSKYSKSIGETCGTSPPNTWAYVGVDDEDSCQSRCTQMHCGCFDHIRDHGPPGPPSPPSHATSGPGYLSIGLKGTLKAVPAGFDAEWVAVLGDGILGGMETWGNFLLRSSSKRRWGPYDDETASSVGWWTDNGGYYHYGGTNGKAGDFELQMHAALAEHRKLGIPFKHWQLDSWWYPKGAGGNGSCCSSPPGKVSVHAAATGSDAHTHRGEGSPVESAPSTSSRTHTSSPHIGVYRWIADSFVFPAGLPALQDKVRLPFVMHNRWYSPSNWYRTIAKVGGQWVGNDNYVLPLDLDDFWNFFFTQQQGYGLAVYEQDFMYSQYDNVEALQTNATFADDWLGSMARHAAKAGYRMQYCMPYPREYLVSTAHPNVVTIRASHDYQAGSSQWKISRSSLVAHAVGLLPFKDTFYTSDRLETGGADHAVEINAQLQLIVAVLSASIVGPSDGKGLTNVTRLMGCCRSDGLVLKAERPAVPIDAVWTHDGPGGELSFAYACSQDGRTQTTYFLAADVESDYRVTPNDLQLTAARCSSSSSSDSGGGGGNSSSLWQAVAAVTTVPSMGEEQAVGQYVVYDWASRRAVAFSEAEPLKLRAAKGTPGAETEWSLSVVAPVMRGGWAVVGEPGKIVGTSSRRLRSAHTLPSGNLVLVAVGAPNEQLEMCAVTAAMQLLCKSGNVGADGSATFTFFTTAGALST